VELKIAAKLDTPDREYYQEEVKPLLEQQLKEAGFTPEIRRDVFPDPFRKYYLVIATRSLSPR